MPSYITPIREISETMRYPAPIEKWHTRLLYTLKSFGLFSIVYSFILVGVVVGTLYLSEGSIYGRTKGFLSALSVLTLSCYAAAVGSLVACLDDLFGISELIGYGKKYISSIFLPRLCLGGIFVTFFSFFIPYLVWRFEPRFGILEMGVGNWISGYFIGLISALASLILRNMWAGTAIGWAILGVFSSLKYQTRDWTAVLNILFLSRSWFPSVPPLKLSIHLVYSISLIIVFVFLLVQLKRKYIVTMQVL